MDGSKPISGGLPHCFPQFGPGEIQQHGFARNLEWDVVGTTDSSVSFKLANNDQTMAMWPHPFECFYKVRLFVKEGDSNMARRHCGVSRQEINPTGAVAHNL